MARKALVLIFGLALALAARAQIGPQDGPPPKLREAMARVDVQRFNVVPQPLPQSVTQSAPDGSRLNGFDRLQRDYPGPRSVETDARVPIPLMIQGAGIPWIPGSGNQLKQRGAVGPDDLVAMATSFTAQHSDLLGIAAENLLVDRRTIAHFGANNRYWSLRLHQVVRDPEAGIVPVRDAHLFFRVNHGNLIQFGNSLAIPPQALSFSEIVSRADAVQKVLALVEDLAKVRVTDAAMDLGQTDRSLQVVLVNEAGQGPGGTLGHQLVRTFNLGGNGYAAEVWIDAHTGDVVNVIDRLEYASGTVRGGVYPGTNTAGTEDLRPLPYIDVTVDGVKKTANVAGVYDYSPVGSLATASLSGPYVVVDDKCGQSSISTSLSPGDMTFGGGGAGTDCTTPGLGGPGNTHAARTAYYHLNLIKEKARRYLNTDPLTTLDWLDQPLTATVNTGNECWAVWDVNMNSVVFSRFTSGIGYNCASGGENAGVILHEFAHGLDEMTSGLSPDSASAEAFADTFAFLQTHDSCIGANYYGDFVCQDGCTTCTGLRDVNPAAGKVKPSNIQSGPINCLSSIVKLDGTVKARSCPSLSAGVMGYEGHCESAIATGATWDLAQAFVAKYGQGAGWALADRLWFESLYDMKAAYRNLGGGWCNPGAQIDGCGSGNWYTVLRAVDDDNGDLSDGTPNSDLIWKAFNDHGIACNATAPPTFTTCVTPPAAPVPVANVMTGKVTLSWPAVPGAASYRIFRNEIACDAGYTPIAEVMVPSYPDIAVANAVTYYYSVQAIGPSDTCVSAFSAPCLAATPPAPLKPANIYMVLDESHSMDGTTTAGNEKKIEALQDAADMVISVVSDYATDGFRLGAVSFSTDLTGTTTLKDLSVGAQKTSLQNFVHALAPTAMTAIGKGIEGAIDAFPAGSTKQKVIMLLSDGIQNVPPNLELKSPPPGAAVGGGALPPDVQFYTVALGSAIQDDLFDDLATKGGIPGFYYSGGTPEIQSNFAFWIAGVLGLDPAGPAAPGGQSRAPRGPSAESQSSETHYHVNKTVRRVTFLVTWPAKGSDLHFELHTPFGIIQPPASAFHAAQGYAAYTVRFPLREQRADVQVGEWVVKVTNNPQQVPFRTYALFDDPALNPQYTTGGDDPVAGEPLPLEARVFENGTPISGLSVQATLDGPGVGVGEALSGANVPPASPGSDTGSAAERKLTTLLGLNPNAFGHAANTVTLIESEPGVYRAELPESQTMAAGTYVVDFSIAGHGVMNGKFERTQRFSRYLRLKPTIGNTTLLIDAQGGVVHLTFTPRDRRNFRLGPGWGNSIKVIPSSGEVGRLVDHLDGSYSTTIEGTANVVPRITITVRGETVAVR